MTDELLTFALQSTNAVIRSYLIQGLLFAWFDWYKDKWIFKNVNVSMLDDLQPGWRGRWFFFKVLTWAWRIPDFFCIWICIQVWVISSLASNVVDGLNSY